MKREKGITLIALVITVIILLILAGITINQLTGNGLFEKAKEAKKNTLEAQEKENTTLAQYEEIINNTSDGGIEKLTAEMFEFTPRDSNWNVKNVKEALDYLYNN